MSDPVFFVIAAGFLLPVVVFSVAVALRWKWEGDVTTGRVEVRHYVPLDMLGVAAVFAIFAGLVGWPAFMAEKSETPAVTADGLVFSILFQFFMAGMVANFMLRRVGFSEWLGLRQAGLKSVGLWAVAAVFLAWAFALLLFGSGYMQWLESQGVEILQDSVKALQENEDPRVFVLMAVAAAVVAPLCEEVVFRGYVYPVAKRFAGSWAAAFCSALFFAVVHGNLAALLPLFVFGLLLVYLYEKTGSLWTPIAAHFLFNAATVAVQGAQRFQEIPPELVP